LDKRFKSFAPFYSQFLQLADFTEKNTGFKNPFIKIWGTRKVESVHEKYVLEGENKVRKPGKNWSLKRLEVMPSNLD
jgi:hypothetical protein